MSIYFDKDHMAEHNTVICDKWEHMCALMKALFDISTEKGALGEYAMCLTEEMGYRLDFKWVSYRDDDVVFCCGSELQEMIEAAVQDAVQDTYQNTVDSTVAYEQGDFDG